MSDTMMQEALLLHRRGVDLLRDENAALRAEIDRLRDQLHLADQSARSSRAEAERIRAEIERILTEARAEINQLCQRAERAERILAALREPSEAVLMGAHQQLRGIFPGYLVPVIRAAVTAAEQEVGGE